MEIINNIKDVLLKNIFSLIIMLLIIGNIFLVYFLSHEKIENTNLIAENNEINENEETLDIEISDELIKVDIKGYINNPGVYELSSNSIVNDLIELAGGIKKGGTTSNINLSKKLQDEMVIIIYTEKELKNKKTVDSITCSEVEINNCTDSNAASSVITNSGSNSNSNNSNNKTDGKISINTATLAELMTLPGIGESKANSIINYRNENGLFSSIEDIMNVSGIGSSIFAQIKDLITT